ncbi:porin [Acidithiobacillus montserratensis]|uniref:Porin n=1 Tax=Acidithiobacillus montserratensis TaxID=2729135 RepID=A0ACD5HGE9_9PROT|nr:porin [Acidithiobacillus montserratensis]MBN2679875.1 porin [Acidithiobacillaceae bacterium]MBU2747125.1 porin [Acidithiobacillus montserratensis]
MKKNLIALAVAAAVLVPGAAFAATSDTSSKVFLPENSQDTGPILYGFAQITGSQQFGTGGNEGLIFGAHRIRLGVKGKAVPGVTYNFQYKWDGAWMSGGPLAKTMGESGVQDAEINFGFIPEVQLKVGKFRVPVGMERTQFGGDDLWFIQRSMNQTLGADRAAGVMFHSPNVMNTGFYYSLGMFDNGSVDGSNAFSSNAFYNNVTAGMTGAGQNPVGGVMTNGSGKYLFAGMVGYKLNPLLNIELSGARSDTASSSPLAVITVINGKDVTTGHLAPANQIDTWNVGARGGMMGLKYMAEYSHVNGYGGVSGLRGSDWYVALAANLHQMTLTPDWLDIEPAVRFERFDWKGAAGSGVPGSINGEYLNNTTIGVNYAFNPNDPYAARVQLNYVIPTGASGFRHELQANGANYAPANAYIYNTMVLQFQAGF